MTTQNLIPSYLYTQYADDADLQAFVGAYNGYAQTYIDWFNTVILPVYTGDQIIGPLLDWVAGGIYGLTRPTLSSGSYHLIGPLNTWAINSQAFNAQRRVGSVEVYVTNDDNFKRIITWGFYKGDGKIFNVEWLKRRVLRFLTGTNGTAPPISNTYDISVAFTSPGNITITVPSIYSDAPVLQEAVSSGVLELPFQYAFTVDIV